MQEKVTLPPQEYLLDQFRYDPTTGKLWWRQPKRGRRMWKSACYTNWAGYDVVCLDYQQFMAHRIIWKMMYNETPDDIDHKDQDKSNNRLDNLRDVSRSVNMLNMKERSFKTLPKGVSDDRGRFVARARINSVNTFIGSYGTVEEAAEAYTSFVASCVGVLT